jgi:hypothetical protein
VFPGPPRPFHAPSLSRPPCARVLRRLSLNRGSRECRVRAAPAVSCANCARKRTRAYRFSGGNPAFPAQSVLTAYAALSPATNSSCHRHRRIGDLARPGWVSEISADLTPATGARTTRFCRPQHRRSSCAPFDRSRKDRPATTRAPDAAASTASRPNVRDDGQRPSSRDRIAEVVVLIWG